MQPAPVLKPYSKARHQIRSGDILLYRGVLAIRVAGRSEYSHAAMAGWWDGTVGSGQGAVGSQTAHRRPPTAHRLMCLETTGKFGGRAVTLSSQIRGRSGRWDVFAVRYQSPRQRSAALGAMIELTGLPYGWARLLRVSLLHLPIIRWFAWWLLRRKIEGQEPDAPHPGRFCSDDVAAAIRQARLELVPNLGDGFCEPGDLARSSLCKYRFTIVEDES
jgi:hypothetical protein